ncbi:DUF736 domain-containing protein [Methylocapsa acidiphila]|uniref:DUF736 domain-containing protein n=1 Tax=Methylocapsa acidiphila TaxID=133552 RepID=UPI00041D02CD|nr:DUF736 domain-containing protein [Methylocapsa acidiphila]
MAHIGTFTRTADGYSGGLRTLTLDVELTLFPANSGDGENAPDFRIHHGASADGPEVGAGWKRTGEKAGAYVSLLINDPVFTQPIRANLFQAEAKGSRFHLLWNRPPKREERA